MSTRRAALVADTRAGRPRATKPGGLRGVDHGHVVGLGQRSTRASPQARAASAGQRAAPRRPSPRPRPAGASQILSSARAWSQSTRSTSIWPRQVSEPGSSDGQRGALAGRARGRPRARPDCRARRRSAGGPRRSRVQPGIVLVGDQDLRDVALGVVAQRRRRRRVSGSARSGKEPSSDADRTLSRRGRGRLSGPALRAGAAGAGDGRPGARGRGRAAPPGPEREAAAAIRELGRGSSGGWRARRRARRGRGARRHRAVPGRDAAPGARARAHARAPARRQLLVPAGDARTPALERWYRRAARAEIGPRLERPARWRAARTRGSTIRGQRTRWASCSRRAR